MIRKKSTIVPMLYFASCLLDSLSAELALNCDPCIERSTYRIRAVVHGTSNDVFWQELKAAMVQTAKDLEIEFEMDLFDVNDASDVELIPEVMAADIRNAAILNPSALIVSLPGDDRVGEAVKSIQDTIPVFAINTISRSSVFADDLALQGFVSMNEIQAGILVSSQLRDIVLTSFSNSSTFSLDGVTNATTGVFINHDPNNTALTVRYNTISSKTEDLLDWNLFELKDLFNPQDELNALFAGCNYTVIQLAGTTPVEATMAALVANGCVNTEHIIGTYDTSALVYDAIAEGTIDFAISQQPYVQGNLAVLMASLYVLTGEKLAVPSQGKDAVWTDSGAYYQAGPVMITAENRPMQLDQVCETEGYPVCSETSNSTSAPATGTCPCTDRRNISLAAFTHGSMSDPFWDSVYAGLEQAASDFGINLNATRFHGEELIVEEVAAIRNACQSDIDGLIASVPNSSVVDAMIGCKSRGIPIMATNIAPESLIAPNLPFVGQNDYRSGLDAGRRLVEAGAEQGWCLVHAELSNLEDRCLGMEDAFLEANSTEFMGVLSVPTNDATEYKSTLETALGDGDWTGYGVLSTGQAQISSLWSVLQYHPELLAGTFDVDTTLYQALDAENFLFFIDQNAYMQGYYSVAMMVWKVSSGIQSFGSARLESGPEFITEVPSFETQQCQSVNYEVCVGQPPLLVSGQCAQLDRLCGLCEGDCEEDADCAEGLVCFVRDSKTLGAYQDVPGCSTNPNELNAKDFCVDANLYTCGDIEPFPLAETDGEGDEMCNFVAKDLDRCTLYGIYCRETCGYCRPRTGANH